MSQQEEEEEEAMVGIERGDGMCDSTEKYEEEEEVPIGEFVLTLLSSSGTMLNKLLNQIYSSAYYYIYCIPQCCSRNRCSRK